MKVTLAHLPQWSLEQPPLGIAYLSAYLRAKGYTVEQRDLSIELFRALPEDKRYLLESQHHLDWTHEDTFSRNVFPNIQEHVKGWIQELAFNDSRVIGLTALSTSKLLTLHVAEKIKEKNPYKVIVIGGPQTARYEEGHAIAKHPFVDFVVPDEGEESLLELLKALEAKSDLRAVKGLLFRENGQVVDTGERPLLQKLDELPFPSFGEFPLDQYKGLSIPILGSRGCVFDCTFCSETVFWKRYRFRSGKSIFEEMKHQSRVFNISGFYIVDSLINGVIPELENLCNAITESGFRGYWGGKASIRPQMTKELLRKMYTAGCRNIDYGIESGSQTVLDDMQKKFTIPVAERVLQDSAEAGIAVGSFFLLGFPTESEEDFLETLRFLRRNHQHLHHVTPGWGAGIQAGSDLHANPGKYGIEFKNDGWHSKHTTPAIREERVKRFIGECETLKVRISY